MKTKRPNVGTRSGYLTVVDNHVRVEGKHSYQCLCKCDCGKYTVVSGHSINSQSCRSCGCKLGVPGANDIRTKRRLLRTWEGMIDRCTEPTYSSYKNYGARGITVCEDWLHSFHNFAEWAMSHGYRNDLTIDRINVNGNYEPSNCRWATWTEQQNNRRSNKLLTLNGKTQTAVMWAREYGIKIGTLFDRLHNGWELERALTEPVHKKAHSGTSSRKGVRNCKLIAFNGKTQTISAWARDLGVNEKSLLWRFENGWNIEDALTIPVKKRMVKDDE